MLLDIILSQWWRPVASSEALDLFHQAMRMVLYRRTTTAIEMVSKVVHFLSLFHLLSPQQPPGDTEQVVA